MASTTDEIAVKLGINVGDFKAALADAGAAVKKLKKEGDDPDFFGSFKTAKKAVNDLRDLFVGGAIGRAVVDFFQTAIDAANKSTDATDKNAAAVRDFARGLDEIKGVGANVAVATVGFFNRIGSAIGDGLVILRAFGQGQLEGAKNAVAGLKQVEETARAAEEVESRLAAVRKKFGAEYQQITKDLADSEKKKQEQQLQGLTVYETEANLTKQVAALREKLNAGDLQQIDRRRLTLQLAQTQLELDKTNLQVRKDRAAAEKKAAEDEQKAIEEFTKASEERRKQQSLSADLEAQLFELRKKAAAAAATQGQTDLSIQQLQTKQLFEQMEIAKARAKATRELTPAEQENLAQLVRQSVELNQQITQKKALLAASNNRQPAEDKLLATLQAQAERIDTQIKGLEARSGVTSNFTAAEAVFLGQLEKQKRAIFEQIALLEERAKVPNTLTKEEEALLRPLLEQGKVYTFLIEKIKERKGSGAAQTAEELEYLDALKKSSATLANQIEQLRTRNNASSGLTETEAKTLAGWEAQSARLREQIDILRERQNSSGGISEIEAATLATWERENSVLTEQIARMRDRQTATGNLAGIENAVLLQWEAQQKALAGQIETMRTRKAVTEEQRAADQARLASLLEAARATEAQILKQKEGGVIIQANAEATVKMTAAEKERLELLGLLKARQELIFEQKRLEEKIQKEGINPDLADALKIVTATIAENDKQIAQRQKISLGIKEDLELFVLQSKNVAALTESERIRLDVLTLVSKEKRLQIEIETLHGKLMEGTITPQEKEKLARLINQTDEIRKQIAAKQELAKVVTNQVTPAEEGVTVEYDGQIFKVGQLIDAKTRLAATTAGVVLGSEERITAELAEQLRIAEQIRKSRSITVTTTGDIGTLDDSALRELNASIKKQLAFLEASSLTQRQDTAEEAILRAQVLAIQKEMDKRREFERAIDLLGSGKTQVMFGQAEFNRLQQLWNPDAQNQTAAGINKISNILEKTFPEAARTVRNLPLPNP